uniref:Receptor expression-enhancing protein n=1 Tax=Anguilla anguilla TaxID=7936 RepID=A0A0E9VCV1_ANGAN
MCLLCYSCLLASLAKFSRSMELVKNITSWLWWWRKEIEFFVWLWNLVIYIPQVTCHLPDLKCILLVW